MQLVMAFYADIRRHKSFAWLFIVILQTLALSAQQIDKTIIVSLNGKDKIGCGDEGAPCRTPDYALSSVTRSNFTELKFKSGNYILGKTHNFTGIQDFVIAGDTTGYAAVEIVCNSNASLAFFHSRNIVLRGIRLRRCADWHSSTKIDKQSFRTTFIKFPIAIQIHYCTNVTLKDVEILESPGLAVNMIDVAGTLKIQDCLFADNFPRNVNKTQPSGNDLFTSSEFTPAGGGVFLKLTRNGSYSESPSVEQHHEQTSNNNYLIENCQFLRNEAPRSGPVDPTETPDSPFSRGGGLAVILKGNASNNVIDIRSCTFVENKADWGGGLQVEFVDITQNNSLFMRNTSFESNLGHFAGGGARISSDNPLLTESLRPHNVLVEDCVFRNNTSMWGGGLAINGATRRVGSNLANSTLNKALFDHCRWTKNKGTLGPAIGAFLKNLNRDGIGPSVPFQLELAHCSVIGSEAVILGDEVNMGHGSIYSVRVPMVLSGNTRISNNSNSAMALDSATVDIRDHVIFSGNTGYRGGAVSMYDNSRFVLHKKSKLVFEENRCEELGGAMYVAAPGPIYVNFKAIGSNLHYCFFSYVEPGDDYEKWETEIVFRGNHAPGEEAGISLYATTLVNCRRVGEKRDNNTVLDWKIIQFLDSAGNRSTVQREVATDPIDILFNSTDWNVAPGQKFNASADLIDEKGNGAFGIINVGVNSAESSQLKLGTPSSLFLSSEGQGLSNIWVSGDIHASYNVTMATFSGALVRKRIDNVALKGCNYGFRWSKSQCVCNSDIDAGVMYCSEGGTRVYIRKGHWAGVVDGQFVTSPCPEGYCSCPEESALVDECLFKPGRMCIDTRDGDSLLCGRCKPGYTAFIGSVTCSPSCNNFLLFAKIPGFGILLMLLIIFVMAVNLDAFTSYLNACLYSYQVMSLLKADTALVQFDAFITFLTGIVDLQIKIGSSTSMCFASGMNEADKLMAMYLVPFFVLGFVIFLTYLVRKYPNTFYKGKWRECCNWCGDTLCGCWRQAESEDQEQDSAPKRKWFKDPNRAICTIFVFCYTTITGISLKLLRFADVGNRRVLFLEGQLGFFTDWKHIVYGVVAIIWIAIFVLPVPILLMFTPYCKSTCARKLIPYFNALQGCFKDRYRWFSAFYFLCRLLLLALATFVPRGPAKRCLLEAACIVFLWIFLHFKPYSEGEAKTCKDDDSEDEGISEEKRGRRNRCQMNCCCCVESEEETQEGREQRNGNQRGDDVEARGNRCCKKRKCRCKLHSEDHDFGWVNTTDALLLANLCLIALISSQIKDNMNKQTRKAMSDAVNTFAYMPLLVLLYSVMRAISKKYWKKRSAPPTQELGLSRRRTEDGGQRVVSDSAAIA